MYDKEAPKDLVAPSDKIEKPKEDFVAPSAEIDKKMIQVTLIKIVIKLIALNNIPMHRRQPIDKL